MSVRRILLDCAVLSLQDSCLYYPSCKSCFSRIDVDPQDATRCRCSRCGYRCLREQVDYRYRLSLKVARDKCIFGVTVFGTCLNPFFGIHASGLQRLVDDLDGQGGASTRSTLLVKAVEDCFIGRHFIFGIKVTGTDSGLWSGGPAANGSCSRDTVQFIASQMILPKATELTGCTVVSYYRVLLQKAEQHELEAPDASKTSRPPATTLLLIPLHSPASIFNNTTLSASGLLRSQHQDCTLTPTPPWQQSLGLVTSSAEQDESCSTQDSGDENSRQTGYSKTPHRALRSCLENPKLTEDTALSPLVSYNNLSFSTYSDLSTEKSMVKTHSLDTWFSSSPSVHKGLPLGYHTKECSHTQLTKTFSPCSLVWDDLPFSESLTEFLCNKENVTQTEPHRNVQNVKETGGKNLETGSQDKKRNTKITLSQSVSSFFFEDEEEQLEGDTYNCSADLFSSSHVSDNNTTMLNTHTETVRMATEGSSLLCNPDKLHLRSKKPNIPHSTPHKQKLKSHKCSNKNNLTPPVCQDFDFIPPSQSTPNIKLTVASGSPASSTFSSTLGEFGLQQDSHFTSSLFKLNAVSANQPPLCARESTKENLVRSNTSTRRSHRFTPKRFWKPDKHQQYLLPQQCRRVQRAAPDLDPNERISHKCDSSVCDVIVCDYEENEVPPTPAAKTRLSMKLRRRLTDNGCNFDSTCERQKGVGVDCKRALLHETLTPLRRSMVQTGDCESAVICRGGLDGPNGYLLDDENPACDWSRDLFLDSL